MIDSDDKLSDMLWSSKHYLSNLNMTHLIRTKYDELVSFKGLVNVELDLLRQQALGCKKCRLCEGRKNVVFDSGLDIKPLIAFVGDFPEIEDDTSGVPFLGESGELLNSAIIKGLKLERKDVYLTSAIKCILPDNRDLNNDEIEACRPYLVDQLKIVSPRVIVCLGGTAQTVLTGIEEGITKLRGKWLEWNGIPVMPTFHPKYVLKNPSAKKDFWSDLKMVMLKVGLVE